MNIKNLIAIILLMLSFNINGQSKKENNFKIQLFGEWSVDKSDSLINKDVEIGKFIFYKNGKFCVLGNNIKIIGKYSIVNGSIDFYNAFVNGKKVKKKHT